MPSIRSLRLAAAVALVAALSLGCGGGEEPPSVNEAESAAPISEPPAEPLSETERVLQEA